MNNPQLEVAYEYSGPSAYNSNKITEIYADQNWQYEVLADNNQIIQIGPRPLSTSEQLPPPDQALRYDKTELQKKATDFISTVAPEVNLSNLTPQNGNKEEQNYFFRYEDMNRMLEGMHPFIQVGFSRTGDLLSYTNTLGL